MSRHIVSGRIPLWHLVALAAGVLALLPATTPLRDLDVWWHVRLGDLIRDNLTHGRGVPQREVWSYPIVGHPWVPTAWLSDVLFSLLHQDGGWRALVVYKVVASAAVLLLLARQVLPRVRAEIGTLVFVLAVASLTTFFSERPQLLSFVLVLVVGPWARRLATYGVLRWWPWVLVTYLWCNLHGLWVLGPLLVGLGGVAYAVQERLSPASRRVLLGSVGTAVLATGVTALTPVGPRLTLQPFAVWSVAPQISEWEPTSLLGNAPVGYGLLLAGLVGVLVVGRTTPVGTLVFTAGVVVFSFAAVRNVAPAVLLLAPVVAEVAQSTVGSRLRRPQSTAPAAAGVVVVAVCAVLPVAGIALRPAVDPTIPWSLLRTLATAPGASHPDGRVHVVADISVSGVIAGTVPHASVAMDTRWDSYPATYTAAYVAMLDRGPHWRATYDRLDPDYAVLIVGTPLADELAHDQHWRVVTRDHGYLLLAPPAVHADASTG